MKPTMCITYEEGFQKTNRQANLTLDLLKRLLNKHNGDDDYDSLHLTLLAVIRDGENQLAEIYEQTQ
jgi:hypothetical protein